MRIRGQVKLWDWKNGTIVRDWMEHTAEVYSVDWNLVNKVLRSLLAPSEALTPRVLQEYCVSGSWDNTAKLWHPDKTSSIRTFRGHTNCIYTTVWHPRHAELFASCSGDSTVRIWDMNGALAVRALSARGRLNDGVPAKRQTSDLCKSSLPTSTRCSRASGTSTTQTSS
jgi:peroxin-7